MCEEKLKQSDNPFVDNGQRQNVVDMKGEKCVSTLIGTSFKFRSTHILLHLNVTQLVLYILKF